MYSYNAKMRIVVCLIFFTRMRDPDKVAGVYSGLEQPLSSLAEFSKSMIFLAEDNIVEWLNKS
jgi:hypothetical protein